MHGPRNDPWRQHRRDPSHDRLASLFAGDGAVRIPHVNAAAVGREQIRAGVARLQGLWDCVVQTTHPGTIQLDGDTASGRAYIFELMHSQDHGSNVNHGTHHDHYRRSSDGWKFTERTYQITYVDTTPLLVATDLSQGDVRSGVSTRTI